MPDERDRVLLALTNGLTESESKDNLGRDEMLPSLSANSACFSNWTTSAARVRAPSSTRVFLLLMTRLARVSISLRVHSFSESRVLKESLSSVMEFVCVMSVAYWLSSAGLPGK